MQHMEWYYVCSPSLTTKSVEPVVSISWASCCTSYNQSITQTSN